MTINSVGNIFNCNPWLKADIRLKFRQSNGIRWSKVDKTIHESLPVGRRCGVGGLGAGGSGGWGI